MDGWLADNNSSSLAADGTRTFEWDGANRLVAITIGNHRSEFSYDGIGRRTRIIEKDNNSVTSNKTYLWCGGEICEERDSTGGTVLKRFFEQGVQDNGVNIHYTRDHLGSIREKTDTGNQVLARYDYDAWGRQTVLAGSKDTFGYAGYFAHSPSGLLLTWYRAYDPNLGRWISRDPIEEEGGINLYGYVGNNPIVEIDSLGLAYKHMPGGPYHPPGSVKCRPDQNCATLAANMAQIARTIASHFAFDLGLGFPRHAAEIADWQNALTRCAAIYAKKCSCCPPQAPGPSPSPKPYPLPDLSRVTQQEMRLLEEADRRRRIGYGAIIIGGVIVFTIVTGGGGAATGSLVMATP